MLSGVNGCENIFFDKLIDFCNHATYNDIVATKGGGLISEQKKMGRPTDNPKTTMFRVRLDDTDVQKLDEAAESLNISKSDVVRRGIDIVHKSLKK